MNEQLLKRRLAAVFSADVALLDGLQKIGFLEKHNLKK